MSRQDPDAFEVDAARRSSNNAASGRNGPNIALIAFGVVIVLAVVFFLQNGEQTNIDFWFFEAETTIRWSILMSILFGVVLDRCFSIWWRRRRKKRDD
jgi:uncharacterized integral membrane protein